MSLGGGFGNTPKKLPQLPQLPPANRRGKQRSSETLKFPKKTVVSQKAGFFLTTGGSFWVPEKKLPPSCLKKGSYLSCMFQRI